MPAHLWWPEQQQSPRRQRAATYSVVQSLLPASRKSHARPADGLPKLPSPTLASPTLKGFCVAGASSVPSGDLEAAGAVDIDEAASLASLLHASADWTHKGHPR